MEKENTRRDLTPNVEVGVSSYEFGRPVNIHVIDKDDNLNIEFKDVHTIEFIKADSVTKMASIIVYIGMIFEINKRIYQVPNIDALRIIEDDIDNVTVYMINKVEYKEYRSKDPQEKDNAIILTNLENEHASYTIKPGPLQIILSDNILTTICAANEIEILADRIDDKYNVNVYIYQICIDENYMTSFHITLQNLENICDIYVEEGPFQIRTLYIMDKKGGPNNV